MTTVDHPTAFPTNLLEVVAAHRSPTCWLCGEHDIPPGARICPNGSGCKDGRIFHGPTGPAPHQPDAPCEVCGTTEAQVVAPRATRTNRRIDHDQELTG